MDKEKHKIKSRFKRKPISVFPILDRDLHIVKYVARYRLLNTDMIMALVDGGEHGIRRRLRKLFHAGYLSRPQHQVLLHDSGSDPMVYTLGDRGADYLTKKLGTRLPKVSWANKSLTVGANHIAHTLTVSNFMVSLEIAARDISNLRLIDQDRIVDAIPKDKDFFVPFGWKIPILWVVDGKREIFSSTVMPDRIFGMHISDVPAKRQGLFFFLEADRSTMPVERTKPFQTSFSRKLHAYWESWRRGLYNHYLGSNAVRVLTITKSNERIETMKKVCRKIDPRGKGSRMFLFSEAKNFSPNNPACIFEERWTNPRDKSPVTILD